MNEGLKIAMILAGVFLIVGGAMGAYDGFAEYNDLEEDCQTSEDKWGNEREECELVNTDTGIDFMIGGVLMIIVGGICIKVGMRNARGTRIS